MTYDLVIIGGGPAGYTAALEAAALGWTVGLYERTAVGGTCLHAGCIPTKTILESTGLLASLKKASYFGVVGANDHSPLHLDFARVNQRKTIVVKKLTQGLAATLNAAEPGKIHTIVEPLTLREARALAPRVLIATGTRPRVLPGTLSTDEALALTRVPSTVRIVGGGAVGLEMATLFRQAGGGVTVVEKAAQILPNAVDPSVASALQRLMEKQGIKFEVGGSPQSPLKGGLEPPDEITISCIGREYCTEELQGADLVFGPRGEVVVDDQMMTNLPSVAAAGDITGKMMLAHVAYAQGKAAISALNGKPLTPIRYDLVPFCVFTSPPLASIGAMTGDCIQTIPLASVGVAQAKGATEGFLRVVVGKEGGVDGVQLIGSQAQELIATASILMRAKIPWAQWSEIIWAHPTLSEIFGGSH